MAEWQVEIMSYRDKPDLERGRYYFLILKKFSQDINSLLITMSNVINHPKDLALLSLILRNGADPNIYVPLAGTNQSEHILSYILSRLSDNQNTSEMNNSEYANFKLFILAMLISFGSDPTFTRFKKLPTTRVDGTVLTNLNMMMNTSNRPDLLNQESYISLESWLGPQPILRNAVTQEQIPLSDIITLLSPNQIKRLELLMDKPSKNNYSWLDLILTKSINILMTEPELALQVPPMGAYSGTYYTAIKTRNLKFIIFLLREGIYPHYPDVNLVLTELLDPKNIQDENIMLIETLTQMAIYGATFDGYQWKTLMTWSGITNGQLNNILSAYQVPYLTKMAQSPKGFITRKLRRLALNCNVSLEKTKAEMVDELIRISNVDEGSLVKAYEERFVTKTTAEHNSFLQFLDDKIVPLKIVARTQVLKSPILVNDHQVTVFEAEDGEFYVFTSDYFIPLLTDKNVLISHLTKRPMELPLQARFIIEGKVNLLNALQIKHDDIIDLITAHRNLTNPDSLSDNETNTRINTMKIVFKNKTNLSAFESSPNVVGNISEIFKNLNLGMENLSRLDITHLWATFYTEMYMLQINPNTSSKIDQVVAMINS